MIDILAFDTDDLPQLIAVLIVALVSGLGSLLKKKEGASSDDGKIIIIPPPTPEPRNVPEQKRQASPIPSMNAPVPKMASSHDRPRASQPASKAQAIRTRRTGAAPKRAAQTIPVRAESAGKEEKTHRQIFEGLQPIQKGSDVKTGLSLRQASIRMEKPTPTNLRTALIMSEILRPPLALRENESAFTIQSGIV